MVVIGESFDPPGDETDLLDMINERPNPIPSHQRTRGRITEKRNVVAPLVESNGKTDDGLTIPATCC